MFHGNVFAVDDLDCTRIGWGLDENNNCVQCSGAAGVKETKTPPSDSEYCSYAGNEIYDIVDNGARCTVNIHICYSCSGTNNPYPNENHSECTTCKDTGYGVVDGVCVKCTDNQNSSYDQNMDANVCVEDPCASDTSCTTAGCGKVGDNCEQCSENYFYVPEKNETNDWGVSTHTPARNICISDTTNMICDDNNLCVCSPGYGFVVSGETVECKKCEVNEYSDQGECKLCGGKLTTQNGLNIGCDQCGANEQPNSGHTACVCKMGYGLDTENGECRKCGGTDHPGETSVPDDSGYKCEKVGFGMIPKYDNNLGVYFEDKNCDSGKIANYDNSVCVDSCTNTGFNNETGYGKYTENNLSQCVKCADYDGQVSKPDNDNSGAYICAAECGAYQTVQPDGSCGYCSNDKYYDFDRKTCVNTCNNSYTVSAGDTNVNVCCGEYQYFDTEAGKCKSCESNQWFEERTCQSCPKNFACNGKTKIKCPFGTVAEAGTGACASKDFPSGDVLYNSAGFLYNLDGVYTNVSENDYYKADDDDKDYYERFVYDSCNKVNGYREPYEIDLGEQYKDYTIDTTNIYVCHQCENTERPNVSGGCLCGQKKDTTAGLIKDIVSGGHGEICQVCPLNNVNIKGGQDKSYTCNPCPDGQGFYWNNGKYVCTACPDGTGLYKKEKDKYTWCLTHEQLVQMEQDAESYYIGDGNVWANCPAGSCCLEGKKYSCKKGTVSLANMVCENGTPGQCADCGGKTTKSEGTACDGLNIEACKTNMCTESITPTTFCIGLNSATGMCFKIEEIKMSLKEGAGVYNTIDITGQTNSGQ